TVTSPQTDPRAFGFPGGKTWTYTNAAWPGSDSPCYTYGFSDNLASVIRGYNPSATCSDLAGVTFNPTLSNLPGGVVVYTGTTSYKYMYAPGFYTVNPGIPVRVTLRFTNSASAPIPVLDNNNYKFIRADQNF